MFRLALPLALFSVVIGFLLLLNFDVLTSFDGWVSRIVPGTVLETWLIPPTWTLTSNERPVSDAQIGDDNSEKSTVHLLSISEPANPDSLKDLVEGDAQLETLGPIVVNGDGTLSRIDNWRSMTPDERAVTLKRIRKRNSERLERIKNLAQDW